jgi:hypothetical protein
MARPAQVTQIAWDDQAQHLMQASADASPWALVESFADNLGRAHLWQIDAGAQRALVALRGLDLAGGRLLEVAGLRSIGAARITPAIATVIEDLARDVYGADLLTMCTRHPHLVRGCERAGWTNVAAIVNKPLRLQ